MKINIFNTSIRPLLKRFTLHRIKKTSLQTKTPDSILLFIRNLYPHENTLSLIIDSNGRVRLGGTFKQLIDDFHVEIDGKEQNMAQLLINSKLEHLVENKSSEDHAIKSPKVTDDIWHSIHLTYKPKKPLYIGLDPDLYFGNFPEINHVCHQPLIVGDSKCAKDEEISHPFYFDPSMGKCIQIESYTGCGANDNQFDSLEECENSCVVKELRSYKPFIGCMKNLYVNSDNLKDTIHDGRELTQIAGDLGDLSNSCDLDEKDILSFTTVLSEVKIPATVQLPSSSFTLDMVFKLKENSKEGILAHGKVEMSETLTNWTVSIYYHLFLIERYFEKKIRG